ncbi:hypothetical protein KP509_13G074100 [Ceratopteris richardii]|uniref:Uncharacterized protein n=1 Tax=Ceratopteris richardii TaxID=49495 RepID=A0A8T2TK03_CERRI|nr:hypothetical protein KP509_13G074100 [Ceratopteris richardii]
MKQTGNPSCYFQGVETAACREARIYYGHYLSLKGDCRCSVTSSPSGLSISLASRETMFRVIFHRFLFSLLLLLLLLPDISNGMLTSSGEPVRRQNNRQSKGWVQDVYGRMRTIRTSRIWTHKSDKRTPGSQPPNCHGLCPHCVGSCLPLPSYVFDDHGYGINEQQHALWKCTCVY